MVKEFKVPCPKHLKLFAQKFYFDELPAPHRVTERDAIGKHIFLLMIDKRSFDLPGRVEEYDEYLDIILSDTLAKRSPDLIKLSRLIPWLDEQFKQALYLWVKAQVSMGESRYQSALRFFKYHQIEDDTLFDTHYTYLKRRTNRDYIKRYEGQEANEI